jgi:pimeloyl-ACP methyl ester carboxylesterase
LHSDPGLRITKTAQFGAFFFGTIGEVYGGIPNLRKTLSIALEGKSGAETPKVPPVDQTRDVPRKIRALVSFKKVDDKFIETRAIPAPVIEYFPAIQKNNETPPKIRVLRYNGGKTPVILIPSVGHSSEVFAMDTNTVSMVEELFSLKFDVYLADMRCSADLPSSFSHDYTLTDLATYDLPVIVDKVLEISGAKTVDIVGHGTGSMVVFISLLSGKLSHSKVRALVASQLATHAHAVPAANKVQFLSDMTKPDEIVRNSNLMMLA